MAPLDLRELAAELAALEVHFEEGEHGLLELTLDEIISDAELVTLEQAWDGQAFIITSPITQDDDGTISIHFEVGIFFLPLIVFALGALPVGLLAWKLSKITAEQWLRTLKGIVIPLGAVVIGGVIIMAGKGRWPSLVAGGAAMAGGGYFAYRELRPVPPTPPVPAGKLQALREHGGIRQPVLAVMAM